MKLTKRQIEIIEDLLINWKKWTWTTTVSCERCCEIILEVLQELEIVKIKHHKHGGYVYKFQGKLYGRTDGVTLKSFKRLKDIDY